MSVHPSFTASCSQSEKPHGREVLPERSADARAGEALMKRRSGIGPKRGRFDPARRGPASVEGDETSREAPDRNGAVCRESARRGSLEPNSRGAGGEVGPVMSGSRPFAQQAGNMPIGSAGLVAKRLENVEAQA